MTGLMGGKPKYEDPEDPATMPDENDPLAKRERRKRGFASDKGSSTASDKLAPTPGTIGREYTRSTLGAA